MKLKFLLFILLTSCISNSLLSQLYLTRNKIDFYIDDIKLSNKQTDSIIVLIKKENEIIQLKDSVNFHNDSVNISLYFIIFDRVIEFHGINTQVFTKNVDYFEFGYIHIDNFFPLTKANIKNTDFEEYKGRFRKHRYFSSSKKKIWDIPKISINGKRKNLEDLYYGLAYFTHSLTEFSLNFVDIKQNSSSGKIEK